MTQLSDDNQRVVDSVIPNQTEAKTMRNLIENKGLLNGKGKLYAGTDDTTSTGAPVTTAIDPSGVDDGSVLIKDSTKDGGWKVDKVGNDNIKTEDVYSVGGIVSSGSVIINPTINDYSFRINNATGGHTMYDDQGMAWINEDGSEGGFLSMPKTFTGGSYVGAQQTIATEEKVKKQLESGEIIAKGARIAQYASEDTSKGTIEERLTSLGFKTGHITLNSDVALWSSNPSSDMVLNNRTQLQIMRCGNYTMFPTQFIITRSDNKELYPLYFDAQAKLTGGEIVGAISSNCVPDRTQLIVGAVNINDNLAGTGTGFIEQFLIKGRDGAPTDLWNLDYNVWTQIEAASIGSIVYTNVSGRGISKNMNVYFPYVGPTPPNKGYSYSWPVSASFSIRDLTSLSLYSTPTAE